MIQNPDFGTQNTDSGTPNRDAGEKSRPGREVMAALHLLDRQVLARGTGRMVAKVDDLELDLEADPPRVTALLIGPQAWGARLPGLLGRFVVSAHRRLHADSDPQPETIPIAHLTDLSSAVEVDHEPPSDERGLGAWVQEQIIRRIPGATDAPE